MPERLEAIEVAALSLLLCASWVCLCFPYCPWLCQVVPCRLSSNLQSGLFLERCTSCELQLTLECRRTCWIVLLLDGFGAVTFEF